MVMQEQTEEGIKFSKELAELTNRYRGNEIDGRELISILIHMAKLHACLGFNDYYYMVGCLASCLHENLVELFEDCSKQKEDTCNQSPAPIAETTSCEEQ